MTRVYLETGRTWVFAVALDWPGWARRGKGEDSALEQLLAYAPRYAEAVPSFVPAEPVVVGRVPGGRTTDFGAPGEVTPWEGTDDLPRLVALVQDCWAALDATVAASPAELVKGPRGGGRDRDAMADHVREAERTYARRAGVAVPPRTPWPEQRRALADGLLAGPVDARWPATYACRRVAWHVLDHAWEMQDRRP
ncbi:MAG: hypothetical protein ACXVGH_10855 [Mycobacteriales bacterium]